MLGELRRFNTIGDISGIAYFSKQVLGTSRVQKSSIQKLCALQNDIRLNFDAAVAFFKYLGLIEEKVGYLYPTEKSNLLLSSKDFNRKLCEICLIQIMKDGFLNIEAVHYKKEKKSYAIERYGFSISAALFRNLLIQYKALYEYDNELLLNSNYEDVFAEYKRKEGSKKTLETLKKQLEQQEAQGEAAELFVMEFEKKRLHFSDDTVLIKRISEIDVSAGYDILSYNDATSVDYDRFIEVKSYLGIEHFYWSKNEIETAKLYGNKYFIYLIDSSKVGISDYEPHIICNPAENIIKSEFWIMSPTSYRVIPTK